MSLINDALKEARKAPPENVSSTLTPLQPVAGESSTMPAWLLPSVVIMLVAAAIFLIGWAVMHHAADTVAARSQSTPAAQAVTAPQPVVTTTLPQQAQPPQTTSPQPAVQPQPVSTPPPPASQPFVLKLQGIDYTSSAASAILNGKTVHPGDQFRQYRVKAISKDSVTLIGPDGKQLQIGMEN